jgi:hypothetical protein
MAARRIRPSGRPAGPTGRPDRTRRPPRRDIPGVAIRVYAHQPRLSVPVGSAAHRDPRLAKGRCRGPQHETPAPLSARYSCAAIGAMLRSFRSASAIVGGAGSRKHRKHNLVGGRADLFVPMGQQTGLVVETTRSSVERRDAPRRRPRLSRFEPDQRAVSALVAERSRLWGIAVPRFMSRGQLSTISR